MADSKSRTSKVPIAIPIKAPRSKAAHKEIPRQKPRPKPKPKSKGAQEQEQQVPVKNESGYIELRPNRNSVHPYEPLCVDTKENPQSTAAHMPAVTPQSKAGQVPAVTPQSTAAHIPAVTPQSTAVHIPAVTPQSTAGQASAVTPQSTAGQVSTLVPQSKAAQVPTVSQSAAVQAPAVNEVHYANVRSYCNRPPSTTGIEDSGYENNATLMRKAQERRKEDNSLQRYENEDNLPQKDFSKGHFISSTCCKITLSVGITVLVVTAIVFVLLVLASLGLSHAKENAAKYRDLQLTAQQMAVQMLILEEHLNNSVTNAQQMAADIFNLKEQLSSSVTDNDITAQQMAAKILALENELHSLAVTANGTIFDRLEQLMKEIRDLNDTIDTQHNLAAERDKSLGMELDGLSHNLTSITSQLNQTLTSHIIRFDAKVEQLNSSMATVNGTVGELVDEVDYLNNSVRRLENNTQELVEDTMMLNSTLFDLITENDDPNNCTSYINQSIAQNSTYTMSPPYNWDSVSVSTWGVCTIRIWHMY